MATWEEDSERLHKSRSWALFGAWGGRNHQPDRFHHEYLFTELHRGSSPRKLSVNLHVLLKKSHNTLKDSFQPDYRLVCWFYPKAITTMSSELKTNPEYIKTKHATTCLVQSHLWTLVKSLFNLHAWSLDTLGDGEKEVLRRVNSHFYSGTFTVWCLNVTRTSSSVNQVTATLGKIYYWRNLDVFRLCWQFRQNRKLLFVYTPTHFRLSGVVISAFSCQSERKDNVRSDCVWTAKIERYLLYFTLMHPPDS